MTFCLLPSLTTGCYFHCPSLCSSICHSVCPYLFSGLLSLWCVRFLYISLDLCVFLSTFLTRLSLLPTVFLSDRPSLTSNWLSLPSVLVVFPTSVRLSLSLFLSSSLLSISFFFIPFFLLFHYYHKICCITKY